MGERGVATLRVRAPGLVARWAGYDSLAAASAALPEGAYTTLRTYGGSGVVRLDQHLRRLEEIGGAPGAGPAALDPPAARAGRRRAPSTPTAHPESRVRLTFAPPRLFVAVEPFAPLAAARSTRRASPA